MSTAAKRRAKRRLQRYYDNLPLWRKFEIVGRGLENGTVRRANGEPWPKSFKSIRGARGGYSNATMPRYQNGDYFDGRLAQ